MGNRRMALRLTAITASIGARRLDLAEVQQGLRAVFHKLAQLI
jgi:hypothetical protein